PLRACVDGQSPMGCRHAVRRPGVPAWLAGTAHRYPDRLSVPARWTFPNAGAGERMASLLGCLRRSRTGVLFQRVLSSIHAHTADIRRSANPLLERGKVARFAAGRTTRTSSRVLRMTVDRTA